MASHKTASAPAGARRAGFAAARAAGSACAAALLLIACSARAPVPSRAEALRGDALGPVVDSVVVRPFERAPGVRINDADLNQFRGQLEAQLLARPGMKAFASPPTTLPNTVILSGKLLGYEVREQTAEGMFLRTIAMAVEVAVRIGGEKAPALVLSRGYSYQKLYLRTEGVAALEYDVHNAAREATGSLARVLVPGKTEPPELRSAVDTDTGVDYAHPWLVRGNRDAGFGRYQRAIDSWSLLLYEPARPAPGDGYRVSARTLARLQREGAPQQQLDELKPLARHRGASLESLRDDVHEALGADTSLEPKVLQLSDEAQDRIQLNLSRARYNLAQVYLYYRRLDVAAYHLAHAWGIDPEPIYLEAWTRLQAERLVIPPSAKDDAAEAVTWMLAYLRVPAPFTSTVTAGSYEWRLMPQPAFAPDEPPPRAAPAPPPTAQPGLPPPVPVPPAEQAPPAAPGARSRAGAEPGRPGQPRPLSQPAQRLGY